MFRGEEKKRQGLHLPIYIQIVIYLQETVITLPFNTDLEEWGWEDGFDTVGMSRL